MSRLPIKRPGIYIEEISLSAKSIEGVDTSTTAFLGETKKGPDTPTMVTSWREFESIFGSYFGIDKFLPYTVEGFFENDGQRCFVCRVTEGDYGAALTKLEAVEPVSIVYSPNALAVAGLADALIEHCEKMKRFCIFDSLKGQAPSGVSKPRSTSFAALYYPWIYVNPTRTSMDCLVPPGGHVAGIYARTDNSVGVHKAPANQVVKGAVSLELEVTQAQQEKLNPQGINCIRSFTGRGILVWGARTLSEDAEFKYVNVRRLMLFLEHSIQQGTTWVVFEPNCEATWAKVSLQVENFLVDCWRKGILRGTTPQEAYFVHCNHATTTQKDIKEGRLNILVGAATIKPAEYLILHITHARTQP
jgi:phage tail sheath protein FI